MERVVIVGNGYVAHAVREALQKSGEDAAWDVVMSSVDIASPSEVGEMMNAVHPDVLINCAGKTGRPNIDWCEAPENRAATWRSNVFGPMVLGKYCLEQGVFLVHVSSGCVYEGDNGGKGFSEDDPPNFLGSLYSRTKIEAERGLEFLRRNAGLGVLQVRLRMPLDGSLSERNLITKLIKYPRVISLPNSISVMDDFLKAVVVLMEKRHKGIVNVVNPGVITHQEILELYRELVDPAHAYTLISLEELEAMTSARRSNCVLNTQQLRKALDGSGVVMRDVHDAVRDSLKKYQRAVTLQV